MPSERVKLTASLTEVPGASMYIRHLHAALARPSATVAPAEKARRMRPRLVPISMTKGSGAEAFGCSIVISNVPVSFTRFV